MGIFEKININKPKTPALEGPEHPDLPEMSQIMKDIYDWFPTRNRQFDYNDTSEAFEQEIKKWSLACLTLHGIEAARLGANVIKMDRLSIEQLRQLTFPFFMSICREEKNRANLNRDTQERLNQTITRKTSEERQRSQQMAANELTKIRQALGNAREETAYLKLAKLDKGDLKPSLAKNINENPPNHSIETISYPNKTIEAHLIKIHPREPKFRPAEMPPLHLDNFEPDWEG